MRLKCIIILILAITLGMTVYLVMQANEQQKQYFPCLGNGKVGKPSGGLVVSLRTPTTKYSIKINRIELWVEFKNIGTKPITFVPRIFLDNVIIKDSTGKRYQWLFIDEKAPVTREEFITLYPRDHFLTHLFLRPIDDFGLKPGRYRFQVYLENWGKYYYVIGKDGKFHRKDITKEGDINLWKNWRAYSGVIEITLIE